MMQFSKGASRRQVAVGGAAIAMFLIILVATGFSTERWVDIDELKADSWLWRLSISAADTAMILLVATLAAGPLYVFRGGRPRVHQPLRRTLGIWAGGFAIVHVALAVFVHARWQRIWSNWLELSPLELASGLRGIANWLGLAQLALVVMLLWLSRDEALRRLGARTWKWLQRSAYLLVVLVGAHALLYHEIEQPIAEHRALVLVSIGLLLAAQIGGIVVVLSRRRTIHA